MTRSYTIEQEEFDEDVCYGDYDGSIRRVIEVVNFYVDGVRLPRERCFRTDIDGYQHYRDAAITAFMAGQDDENEI